MVKFFATNGKFSFLKVGTQVVVLCALVLGIVAFVGNNKTVTISVDGKVSSVQTFGGTVEQVVKNAKVELKAADRVSPALDSTVSNGTVINVNLAKQVKVSLDGTSRNVQTTSRNVEGLVTELGVSTASAISVPKDMELAVSGTVVTISTPKNVAIVADGKTTKRVTTATLVSKVLSDAGVKLDSDDTSSQPMRAAVVNNMVIKVARVDTTKRANVDEAVDFQTVKSYSSELYKGEEEVTVEGVPGKLTKVYKLVLVDGKEVSRTLLTQKMITKPVAEQVTVGTKSKPKPQVAAAVAASSNSGAAAPAMMNEAMWDRIAQCESTGNWSINTGNGYYGGLQFDIGTWLGAGGGAYAPNAAMATKAQQIDIANRVYAQRGLSPWGCGWAAGA
ncbi:transglycosylase family protein [Pseudarthrobacter sp. J1738]|uniref:transglycosylase family protein n=1 Tax=unclassified Pseudarthrobacter TaxID=2647000 RepID=UPI003D2D7E53